MSFFLEVKSIKKTEKKTDQEWQNFGLETLVDLVNKGEINPWDVDLVILIDKFLSKINSQDLQQVAEIIFFVSVLLRIKSENINKKEYLEPELNNPENTEQAFNTNLDDLIDFDELESYDLNSKNKKISELKNPKILDSLLVRNQKTFKKNKKRKITLNDLVDAFQRVEIPKIKTKKKQSFQDFELDINSDSIIIREEDENSDILEIAHEENLEEKIKLLSEHILKFIDKDYLTSIQDLMPIFNNQKIDAFLSVLFLSHSGKTEIYQEKFYEDFHFKRLV